MWLVGVVVRRYIDILIIIINFPTPLVLGLFLAAASLLLCSTDSMIIIYKERKYLLKMNKEIGMMLPKKSYIIQVE